MLWQPLCHYFCCKTTTQTARRLPKRTWSRGFSQQGKGGTLVYDNKVRLSQDVLDKADEIANAWGMKNVRAAIEAVFRKYADDYLNGNRVSEIAPKEICDRIRQMPPDQKAGAIEALSLLGLVVPEIQASQLNGAKSQ